MQKISILWFSLMVGVTFAASANNTQFAVSEAEGSRAKVQVSKQAESRDVMVSAPAKTVARIGLLAKSGAIRALPALTHNQRTGTPAKRK